MRIANLVSALLLWSLLGGAESWGQAVPGSTWKVEEPAYNAFVARTYLIEVQPLVEKYTGWEIGGFPKFLLATRDEYCKAAAPSLVPSLRARMPELTEAQALSLAQDSLRTTARGLLGRYDYVAKTIYLLPGNLKPVMQAMNIHARHTRDLIEIVIAHEMTHAVQDARHPVSAVIQAELSDDAFEAYAMLLEGHACHIQEQVAKDLKLDESSALMIQRMNAENETRIGRNGRGSWDRYVTGKKFVDAIFARGGLPEVQKIFLNPPTSREVIVDPTRYQPGQQSALLRK
jgi:hypothetical protein